MQYCNVWHTYGDFFDHRFKAKKAPSFPHSSSIQVASFTAAALYSGLWWRRWVHSGQKDRMWPLLGRFCGLVCVGSLMGVLTWIAASQSNVFYYKFNRSGTRQQYLDGVHSYNVWMAVFYSVYGVEFFCLIAAKLMLLGRLTHNATRVMEDRRPEMLSIQHTFRNSSSLSKFFYAVSITVILSCFAGMVSYFVAAAYAVRIANVANLAASLCDAQGNHTDSSLALVPLLERTISNKHTAHASQSVCEALGLLLTAFAYAVLVTLSVTIFRRVEQVGAAALVAVEAGASKSKSLQNSVDNAINAAAVQRRRLTLACVVVLITFPARAVFDLLQAYSSFDAGYSAFCGPCEDCQTNQYIVRAWINYTPEFNSITMAVSSPLPLVLSLWLITSAHARAHAVSATMQKSSLSSSGSNSKL